MPRPKQPVMVLGGRWILCVVWFEPIAHNIHTDMYVARPSSHSEAVGQSPALPPSHTRGVLVEASEGSIPVACERVHRRLSCPWLPQPGGRPSAMHLRPTGGLDRPAAVPHAARTSGRAARKVPQGAHAGSKRSPKVATRALSPDPGSRSKDPGA